MADSEQIIASGTNPEDRLCETSGESDINPDTATTSTHVNSTANGNGNGNDNDNAKDIATITITSANVNNIAATTSNEAATCNVTDTGEISAEHKDDCFEGHKVNAKNNSKQAATAVPQYQARSIFKGGDKGETDLEEGEIVGVLEKTGTGWWKVHSSAGVGWVPSHFLRIPRDSPSTAPTVADLPDDDYEETGPQRYTPKLPINKESIKLKGHIAFRYLQFAQGNTDTETTKPLVSERPGCQLETLFQTHSHQAINETHQSEFKGSVGQLQNRDGNVIDIDISDNSISAQRDENPIKPLKYPVEKVQKDTVSNTQTNIPNKYTHLNLGQDIPDQLIKQSHKSSAAGKSTSHVVKNFATIKPTCTSHSTNPPKTQKQTTWQKQQTKDTNDSNKVSDWQPKPLVSEKVANHLAAVEKPAPEPALSFAGSPAASSARADSAHALQTCCGSANPMKQPPPQPLPKKSIQDRQLAKHQDTSDTATSVSNLRAMFNRI